MIIISLLSLAKAINDEKFCGANMQRPRPDRRRSGERSLLLLGALSTGKDLTRQQ
jgi:hypothetical protein